MAEHQCTQFNVIRTTVSNRGLSHLLQCTVCGKRIRAGQDIGDGTTVTIAT